MNDWSKKFPTEAGLYWFYGYRHGRVSCGHTQEPVLRLVKVQKNSTSGYCMYVSEGSFMYEKEVEEPHFKKVDLPLLPELEKE